MSYPWKTKGESITLTATTSYTEGQMVVIGDLVGIAGNTCVSGELLALHLYGELTLPKAAGLAVAVGDLLFWDTVNSEVTKTATDAFFGKATAAAAGGAATVDCVLTPGASLDDGTNAALIAALGSSPANTLNVLGSGSATFSVGAGKAIGTHLFGPELPDNAIILWAMYEVSTTFQSAGPDAATIALGLETDAADGLVTAIAISNGGNPWDAGSHDTKAVWTAATQLKAGAAGRQLVATVAVQALTAGALTVHYVYVVGA